MHYTNSYCKKEVSSEEITRSVLRRIEAVEERVKAMSR